MRNSKSKRSRRAGAHGGKNSLIAYMLAMLTAAGGGGAITGKIASWDTANVQAYRLEQVEKRMDNIDKQNLDKRISLLESIAARFDATVQRFQDLLDKMSRSKRP